MTRVGYVPYSKDLRHPADRRRLAAWANDSGTELVLNNPLDSEILFLSNAANFGYWIEKATQPVVLDLVDAYIGENPSFIKDCLRNITRSIRRTSDLKWMTYTNHLKKACESSAAVVVASPEQREYILPLNKNVYVILDNHSELDDQIRKLTETSKTAEVESVQPERPFIFWEGFGYTLKHFRFISKALDDFLSSNGWGLTLVTVPEFPRWGGYIGKIDTQKLMNKLLPKSANLIKIVPWSIENLVSQSRKARFSIIPLDADDKFASLKSENKLLSNWHLGLVTIFSDTPAYSRTATDAGALFGSTRPTEWAVKLDSFITESDESTKMKKNTSKFILEEHSSTILKSKWDLCISEVLGNNFV